MSLRSARLFLEQLKKDENLRQKHHSAIDRRDRHRIIEDAGFDFSDDELRNAIDNLISRLIKKRYHGIPPVGRMGNS